MILADENRGDFERRFGPTYYSFDWGPLHCIVLDGNKPLPGETGWQAVHGAVEGTELEWLRADLALQPPGKPIVVGVHIPIVSSYPERRSTSPEDAPYWEMTNREVLTDLFAQHHVRLVLQGHMHENERTVIEGVEYFSSISVSGSWWQRGEGLERGVDNSPRGYRIVSVDGVSVTHRYQSSAESRTPNGGEFYELGSPRVASAASEFVFNCYDAPNAATAVAHIDEGPWQPMPTFAAPSPITAGLTMPHHYRLITDTREPGAGSSYHHGESDASRRYIQRRNRPVPDRTGFHSTCRELAARSRRTGTSVRGTLLLASSASVLVSGNDGAPGSSREEPLGY